MVGGAGIHLLGDGVRDIDIPVVHGCIWNALVVILGFPTFDDIGSLSYPLHWVVHHPP